MTNEALQALQQLRALRKHPAPQTQLAEAKILRRLNLNDLIAVTTALEQDLQGQGRVPRG
jgi:hypothetical protein